MAPPINSQLRLSENQYFQHDLGRWKGVRESHIAKLLRKQPRPAKICEAVLPNRTTDSSHIHPQVDERLDADKGADVAEGRGEGGAEGAELEGEDLADEQPRDGVEAEAEGRHEEDDARQGDPVQRGRGKGDLKLRLMET